MAEQQMAPQHGRAEPGVRVRGDGAKKSGGSVEPRSFEPLSLMSGTFDIPAAAPFAMGEAGLRLLARRSEALTDYWTALIACSQPWDMLAANTDYWTRLFSDYLGAMGDGVRKGVSRGERRHLQ